MSTVEADGVTSTFEAYTTIVSCQFDNFRRHGCREKERLSFLRNADNNFSYIMNKTHIQHPVGFIEHKYFYIF